ncbi:protein ZBED8-like [Oopsacas minuta]|uniref:Protein ZBED8-like n=1 Tax=Oopsacas minuta TaxID=111878 RepID=A0AAV7JLZ1_9METZ|nr:protein ZBED8-like [Oopsacas minuta]
MATKRAPKRAYLDDYLKFGFTSIVIEGIEKPQCVICLKVLSAESMKPFELKRHFEKEHSTYNDRNVSFFQRQSQSVKKSRLDTTGQTAITIRAEVEASYVVSTIGEELVLPCTKDIVCIMIGADVVKKLSSLSISDNNVQRRIQEMSEDIKNQVVEQIKQSPIFVLQLDEPTDVSSCAQLMIYVRYIHDSNFKEEFLFCRPLDSQTRGIDVFNKVDTFFCKRRSRLEKSWAVCTDGAPSMLGSHSGFQTRVRQFVPDVITNHCMIDREALAAKTLLASLNVILQEVFKIVNFVKSSAVNTRLFRNLCLDMDAAHMNLLYHTEVR